MSEQPKLSAAAMALEAARIVSEAVPHTQPAGLLLFAKCGEPGVAYATALLLARSLGHCLADMTREGKLYPEGTAEAIAAEVDRRCDLARAENDRRGGYTAWARERAEKAAAEGEGEP